MILKDRELLNEDGSIPVELICRCIQEHEEKAARLEKLNKYVDGDHAILHRHMADNTSNIRVVANHAEYICSVATGYVHGEAVSYNGDGADRITDLFMRIEEDSHNADMGMDISIFGRAYELLYMNMEEQPYPELAVLNPRTTNVVKDNSVQNETIFAFNYLPKYSMDNVLVSYTIFVYDDENIYTYETKNLYSAQAYVHVSTESHYFGSCPVIEYSNNKKQHGDFEGVITLIDAYNLLQSDRMNDKEALADALLAIENASLGDEEGERSETAEFIRKERILELPEGGKAYWLTKTLNEAQVEILKKAIKDDIHEFSKVPCLTDENFVGNSSGVAMKYKLFGLEQLGQIKERYFRQGLRQRLKMICHIFYIMGQHIDYKKIDIAMKRSLPVDEESTANIAQATEGLLSWETRVQRYDAEIDVELERERLAAERQAAADEQARAFGSYEFK